MIPPPRDEGAPTPAVTAPKLLNLVRIAELLDVSKQRVDQLRHRADFPVPAGRSARGDLWAASDAPSEPAN